MKIFLVILLCFFALPSFAGGSSEAVILNSLTEKEDDEFVLKYKVVSSEEIYTIHLAYDSFHYLLNARFLTKDKFRASILVLKEQLESKKVVQFGFFGGGPCLIDKDKHIYRSDALDTYNNGKIVYAFCEYS
jgi:hypothetical protein